MNNTTWGIDDTVPPWLFGETDTAAFDNTATPLWAVAVEALDAWEWQQSVCVVEGCEIKVE